jgi:hypothetical protein
VWHKFRAAAVKVIVTMRSVSIWLCVQGQSAEWNLYWVWDNIRARDNVIDWIRPRWFADWIVLWTRFSAPWDHPASYTIGTGSFPGENRLGRGVDHTPPSSAEVKERVQLYLYSSCVPSWQAIRRNLPVSLLPRPSDGCAVPDPV